MILKQLQGVGRKRKAKYTVCNQRQFNFHAKFLGHSDRKNNGNTSDSFTESELIGGDHAAEFLTMIEPIN